ncbi:hypothetical protein COLO4_02368, partial [Corchorus olitorius]
MVRSFDCAKDGAEKRAASGAARSSDQRGRGSASGQRLEHSSLAGVKVGLRDEALVQQFLQLGQARGGVVRCRSRGCGGSSRLSRRTAGVALHRRAQAVGHRLAHCQPGRQTRAGTGDAAFVACGQRQRFGRLVLREALHVAGHVHADAAVQRGLQFVRQRDAGHLEAVERQAVLRELRQQRLAHLVRHQHL